MSTFEWRRDDEMFKSSAERLGPELVGGCLVAHRLDLLVRRHGEVPAAWLASAYWDGCQCHGSEHESVREAMRAAEAAIERAELLRRLG